VQVDVAIIALWVLPLLLAVICHEVAHGYVADRLGDPTARYLGRLTLNPIPHIDPIGTVLLPGFLMITGAPFLFGYAKPVPINWHNLRNPARDMVYVAAAGPATNLALAVASAVVLALSITFLTPTASADTDVVHAGFMVAEPVAKMALFSIRINVMLAVFNMLPVPPLDGGRVAVGLLPHSLAEPLARVEPFGFLIILTLIMTNSLSFLSPLVSGLVNGLAGAVLH
jgi:Zn-dependent protease